jgi:hypothetical protein
VPASITKYLFGLKLLIELEVSLSKQIIFTLMGTTMHYRMRRNDLLFIVPYLHIPDNCVDKNEHMQNIVYDFLRGSTHALGVPCTELYRRIQMHGITPSPRLIEDARKEIAVVALE